MEQKLGSSLAVPCVQELVKESMNTVLARYIRTEQDSSIVSHDTRSPEFPVIDMKKLLSGEEDLMETELVKLHLACKDWGFFHVVNHGVCYTLLEKLKVEAKDFFNLSMEEKKKYWQFPAEMEGFGQHFVVSEQQKLDWADLFFLTTQPIHLRRPHLFPNLPLPFRDTVNAYSTELKNLAMTILTTSAKALKMDSKEMEVFFDDGIQRMRMNYYPPCPEPEKVIGLTPHSDATGLTILFQVNEVEGLQIKKDGNWVLVKPLPNAFIVNVGDMLEIISNGEYRSMEQR